MRILITGGAGFIGSHVAQHLVSNGHDVLIYDRKPPKRAYEHVIGDVQDAAALAEAGGRCDATVHLAAVVSVPETEDDPERARAINIDGSENVLAAAKAANHTGVVLASSAAVYGLEPRVPTSEEEPRDPQSVYAETKAAMEDLAAQYAERGLNTVCLRFFNVYGPGQDPKSQYAAAIPAFISRALKNEPLTIYGDGKQTRDFIHAQDVARAVERALGKTSTPINIATGTSISVNELATTIIRLTQSTSAAEHAPARKGDPRTSLASTGKATETLGFTPEITFEEGLEETIASFRTGS